MYDLKILGERITGRILIPVFDLVVYPSQGEDPDFPKIMGI